jgi:hypothetical protein
MLKRLLLFLWLMCHCIVVLRPLMTTMTVWYYFFKNTDGKFWKAWPIKIFEYTCHQRLKQVNHNMKSVVNLLTIIYQTCGVLFIFKFLWWRFYSLILGFLQLSWSNVLCLVGWTCIWDIHRTRIQFRKTVSNYYFLHVWIFCFILAKRKTNPRNPYTEERKITRI